MGKENKVHHGAALVGSEPQDFHDTGESRLLVIGNNNDICENAVVSGVTHGGILQAVNDS